MPWTGSILILAAMLGQTSAPSTDTVVPTADDSKTEKLVCKEVKALGPRLRAGRTCMSAKDWEQRTKADRKTITDIQNRPNCPPMSCGT